MLDQRQVTPITIPVLSALLEHPDVQEGLRNGQECFREGMFHEDHEKAWAEEDILQFVEEELSRKRYRREQRIGQVMGNPGPLTYTISAS
jgi:hypothetical protein